MDLRYPESVERFRSEIRAFIASNLPEGWAGEGALTPERSRDFRQTWRAALVDADLLAPQWPVEYGGRGLSMLEFSVLVEEFVRAGVPHYPHPNDGFGLSLFGPAVLTWGTGEQKQRFLPPTITGEFRWAQGYSEPEAGSDLFSLRTVARAAGDEWVINGQKVWQTAGTTANWIFVLVRTDPDVPKSRGLTFMAVPIDQPGVEVRPILNLTHEPEFAEVFFTDARTSADNVIGAVNDGARVALTVLGHERGANGLALAFANRLEIERLAALMRSRGLAGRGDLRVRLGRATARVELQRALALRLLARAAGGAEAGPLSSLVKLMNAEHRQVVSELALDVLGDDVNELEGGPGIEFLRAQPLGTDATISGIWAADFLNTRAGTIYGGSSEIQRTTIGEQLLGLPREPR